MEGKLKNKMEKLQIQYNPPSVPPTTTTPDSIKPQRRLRLISQYQYFSNISMYENMVDVMAKNHIQ